MQKMKKRYKKLLTLSMVVLLLICSVPVSAASPLKLKISGKTVNYTKKQLKVTYNGKNIPITTTPAIALDGSNMIPYYYIFVTQGPKMKRTYNKNTGCLLQ